jgi:hypothetical protein
VFFVEKNRGHVLVDGPQLSAMQFEHHDASSRFVIIRDSISMLTARALVLK